MSKILLNGYNVCRQDPDTGKLTPTSTDCRPK